MAADTVVLLSETQCRRLESFLVERIHEFNVETTGYVDGRLLGASIRGAAGEVIAGLSGHTWGHCCEVSHLWVGSRHRRRGLGRSLVRAAEAEAVRRGCSQVVLTTHSFQSPVFYERLGYAQKYVIEGRPRGHANIIFVKPLPSPDGASRADPRRAGILRPRSSSRTTEMTMATKKGMIRKAVDAVTEAFQNPPTAVVPETMKPARTARKSPAKKASAKRAPAKKGAGRSADAKLVSTMEDYEVKYLAQKHSVTQKAVKEAVTKVGHSRNKVEAELKRGKAG